MSGAFERSALAACCAQAATRSGCSGIFPKQHLLPALRRGSGSHLVCYPSAKKLAHESIVACLESGDLVCGFKAEQRCRQVTRGVQYVHDTELLGKSPAKTPGRPPLCGSAIELGTGTQNHKKKDTQGKLSSKIETENSWLVALALFLPCANCG